MRDVRVWHADIAETALLRQPDAAAAWLTAEERVRYDRFAVDQDRQMFLLGRAMARTLVGTALGVSPRAWEWGEGPHGRPEIGGGATPLRFNLTHSAGLVACALAWDRDVGVDVEDLERRPVDRAVVTRYCAPAEVADIDAHGDRWHDRFLHYWTLKEAYLKARGLGIAVPLAQICFRLDNGAPRVEFLGSLLGTDARWALTLVQPTPRHVLAVAASTAGAAEPVWHVDAWRS